jgi:DUF2075 family protein
MNEWKDRAINAEAENSDLKKNVEQLKGRLDAVNVITGASKFTLSANEKVDQIRNVIQDEFGDERDAHHIKVFGSMWRVNGRELLYVGFTAGKHSFWDEENKTIRVVSGLDGLDQ